MNSKSPEIRFDEFTDDWEQRKLDLIFKKIRNAFVGTATPYYVEDGNFYLESNNVKDGSINRKTEIFINNDFYEKQKDKWLHTDDIVMVQSGHVGHTAVIPEELNNTAAHAVIMFQGYQQQTDPHFLNFQFQTGKAKKELSSITTGNTIKHILASEMKKFKVSVPQYEEQNKVGDFFKELDNAIALHQRKLENLGKSKKAFLQSMFPKKGKSVPEIRFERFDKNWERCMLADEFEKINERNDGSFGKNNWISVAKMYFQDPEKVQSNNIDTRTYVMREGDIAFEGHPNAEFKFGRFVANDIGPGVVSELFPIYRHKKDYDNNYWKTAIQLERIMSPIFAKSITSSGNSSNKLDSKHFLRQKIYIANPEEQKRIGSFFKQLDDTIVLQQQHIENLQQTKKAFLQKMFV